jgi:photosystem II stability/assembly factor-like uncharacterized protein
VFRKLAIGIVTLSVCLMFWPLHRNLQLPANKISGIIFLNPNRGFVQELTLSHPEVYETLDGGKTWNSTLEGVVGFRSGRSFATNLKGWSIDEKTAEYDRERWAYNTVYVTEDGGRTWQVSLKTNQKGDFAFGGIQAITEAEVWVVGISGSYRSTDGGTTWHKSGPPGTGLQFLDINRAWVEGDKLWWTNDGGKSWSAVEKDGKTCFAGLGFYFLDDKHGWAVSGDTRNNIEGADRMGHVLATTDGGITCEDIAHIPGQILYSIFFLNEMEGWAGGIGAVFQTKNGGRTWSQISGN